MTIPSFVGPLVSAFLFLAVVFGFCLYYCYFKPKRLRRKDEEYKKNNIAKPESPSLTSCPSRAAKKKCSLRYDEECSYGSALSPYSAGYCFHGGFPMVNCYEQRWEAPMRKMKYQTPMCKLEQCKKPSKPCCELRVTNVIKKPCVSRQLSCESPGARNVCHLQVIQECEEEKEENEDCSEINNKDLPREESVDVNAVAT